MSDQQTSPQGGDPRTRILPRTPLGVSSSYITKYGQTSVWFKAFFQNKYSLLAYVDGQSGGSPTNLASSSTNNGFAVDSWGGPENYAGFGTHLYFTTSYGGALYDWYERHDGGTGGWSPGTLGGKFKTARYSNLAVSSYDGGSVGPQKLPRRVFLYYQDANTDEIREIITDKDGNWVQGTTLTVAAKGSAIAANVSPTIKRVWYQLPDTTIALYESGADGEWKKGNFKSSYEYDPGAALSVAGSGPTYQVFTTQDNTLIVTGYNAETGVSDRSIPITSDLVPYSAVAAIAHPTITSSGFTTTVFVQKEPDQITRVQSGTDGSWKSANIPVNS